MLGDGGRKRAVVFRIGEFSRLTLVPVTTLRYYADLGILVPAYVDPETGYRYFSAEQVPLVNRLLVLKDLGLSLGEVKAVVADELGPDELRGMLRLKRAEIGRRVEEEQQRLDRVEARLRLIEKEGGMPGQEIVIKQVQAVRGLGCRDTVDQMGIGPMFGDVLGGVMMQGATPSGPPMAVYHDPEFDPAAVDMEVLIPTAAPPSGATPGGREIVECVVPAAEAAVTVHLGPYPTLGEAYQALLAWFSEQGRTVGGPAVEVYLTGPDEPGGPVTEVRLPIGG